MRSLRSASRSYLAGRFGQPPAISLSSKTTSSLHLASLRFDPFTISHLRLLKQSQGLFGLPSILLFEIRSARQLSTNQRQYCTSWLKFPYTFRGLLPLSSHLRPCVASPQGQGTIQSWHGRLDPRLQKPHNPLRRAKRQPLPHSNYPVPHRLQHRAAESARASLET